MALDAQIEWTRIKNGGKPDADKPQPATVAEKIRMALSGRKRD
jgi:hypothetical protein